MNAIPSVVTRSALALLLVVSIVSFAAAGQPGDVALGDSIDFGIGSSTGAGWVVPFHAYLESVFSTTIDLDNLAVPGAETKDIDQDQLAAAVSDARAHAADGVVVTIGGGGNDLRHFIVSPSAHACLQVQSCLDRINALLDEVEQRMDLALKELRRAAPQATILVRTQYNALRGTGCAPPDLVALADAALEAPPGSVIRDGGLNWRLRAVAAKNGAKVIEIFLPFAFFGDAVLAGDCIHPNDAGYNLIVFQAITAFSAP
jgi:lysophospholipase L1-like esterase